MRPPCLPILEQKLPAHLPIITPLERLPPRHQTLKDGLHHHAPEGLSHVLGGGLAEVEGARHAEFRVEGLGGVGVDGEGAGGGGGVKGDEVRLAAADDDEGGRRREGVESLGRDGGAEGAEVFLADLCVSGFVSCVFWEEKGGVRVSGAAGRTYAAEEVADEDYQHAAVFGGGVEGFEGDGGVVCVEDGEVIDGAEVGRGGRFLGDSDVAGELAVGADWFGGVVIGVLWILGRGGGPCLGIERFGGFGHGHGLYTHLCSEEFQILEFEIRSVSQGHEVRSQ